jgi:hypothetical protein
LIEPINISAIGWNEFKRSNPPGDYLVYGEIDDSRYFQLFHISSSTAMIDGVDIHSPWGLRIFPEQIIYLIQEKYATREEFVDLLAKDYPQYLQYFLFQQEFLNG